MRPILKRLTAQFNNTKTRLPNSCKLFFYIKTITFCSFRWHWKIISCKIAALIVDFFSHSLDAAVRVGDCGRRRTGGAHQPRCTLLLYYSYLTPYLSVKEKQKQTFF